MSHAEMARLASPFTCAYTVGKLIHCTCGTTVVATAELPLPGQLFLAQLSRRSGSWVQLSR